MQSRHRKRHRIIWAALAPLAVAALIYAMINRVEMPVMNMKDLPVEMERGPSP